MTDKPLVLSLLIGLVVVLLIAGVSILVKMNSLSDVYKQELAKSITLQKNIEDLKSENESLEKDNKELQARKDAIEDENASLKDSVTTLQIENKKLEKLKEKLEDNLTEELIKKNPKGN
ncbi:MAG: hypothetical protein GY858_02375 [Candidatus Omnitrophica bacterium]|nr:hypothetical protein [Candidatus Omnitrophota bacterium]